MTTPAQHTANQRNAQRSTGPRTDAGKARSSQNPIKHAVHARTNRAVTAGPFEEDADSVDEFMSSIVERLDPMDAPMRSLASRIAGIHLKMARLEIYEAVALRGGTRTPGRRSHRALDDDEIDALNEEVVARYAIEGVLDATSRLWTSLYRQLRIAMTEYERLRKLRAHASTTDTLYDDDFYRGLSPAERQNHVVGELHVIERRLQRFSAEAGVDTPFEVVPATKKPFVSGERTVADMCGQGTRPRTDSQSDAINASPDEDRPAMEPLLNEPAGAEAASTHDGMTDASSPQPDDALDLAEGTDDRLPLDPTPVAEATLFQADTFDDVNGSSDDTDPAGGG